VDGKGYPDGLKGEEISLAAKVVNVADAFDAMTTDRPYRAGLRVEDAIAQMLEKSGSQFDPEVVEVLVSALRSGQIRVAANRTPYVSPDRPGPAVDAGISAG